MADIYFTFDDGPNEPFTSQILDTLKEFGAKATFFVCGKAVERHPNVAKRIVQEGHAIGNHTYSHSKTKSLTGLWGSEIEKTSKIIENAAGVRTRLFRPPWGRLSKNLQRNLQKKGYKIILWDVEAHDWEQPGAKVIAQRVVAGAKPNAIVLLHDGHNTEQNADRSQTSVALPIILRALQKQGYTFAALS